MIKKTFSLFSLAVLLFSCGGDNLQEEQEQEQEQNDAAAYIATVFDYLYAPGQNAQTPYSATPENFVGKPSAMLSLGGWGGYIVGGFAQDVMNGTGNDFIVFCGGSIAPEPGVVYVMADENGNNLPDDTWYELKGSENDNAGTVHNYELTYFKPLSADENVRWEDNKGNSGELINGYQTGSTALWWKNNDAESVTFKGTRLPDAYINISETGAENWVVHPELFLWGYAENGKGTDYNPTLRGNEFDIDNAIDADGNAVELSAIRFIKIQSGVFQPAGWLNEISTEVLGAADLRLLKK